MIQKFRKKPIIIEAIQIGMKSNEELINFVESLSGQTADKYLGYNEGHLYIHTLEGVLFARDKDWLIHGINGEFYPCKPEIFEKTYENVEHPDNKPPDPVRGNLIADDGVNFHFNKSEEGIWMRLHDHEGRWVVIPVEQKEL